MKSVDTAQTGQERIEQFVCFLLADEEYAVDIHCVQEVVRMQRLTPVPHLPVFVLGIINIRGNVVPVYDLRKKFKLKEKAFDEHTKVLVLNVDGELCGYIVDEIRDNIKLSGAQLDPRPNVKMEIPQECFSGIGILDKRMIVVLNVRNINKEIERDISALRAH